MVAEKPDAAKKLSHILSGGRAIRRNGFSKYNPIFEFEFDQRGSGMVHVVVTSVMGHVFETEFDEKYRVWHQTDPAVLFDLDTPVLKIINSVSHRYHCVCVQWILTTIALLLLLLLLLLRKKYFYTILLGKAKIERY